MHWLKQQWFLLAITGVVLAGIWGEPSLRWMAAWPLLRTIVVITVLFLMSLPLELRSIVQTLARPQAALLASVINLGLGPLLVIPFLYVLETELAGGLVIALATPCTLASAAVWTRRAGGNDITALMVTVLTNLSCVVVTPLWLWLLSDQSSGEISLSEQIQKLVILVVLPIVAAQLARRWSAIGHWATRKKPSLSILAQIGLLYIVLLGTMGSSQRWGEGSASEGPGVLWFHWAILLFAIAVIHLTLFFTGYILAVALRLGRPEHSAVAISGSQKTLMVGAEMGLTLGLSVLPLLIYHLFQLFVDTILADWMRRKAD